MYFLVDIIGILNIKYMENRRIYFNMYIVTHIHQLRLKFLFLVQMFLRALRIYSHEFLNEELNYIKYIAKSHRYPNHTIDRACLLYTSDAADEHRDVEISVVGG